MSRVICAFAVVVCFFVAAAFAQEQWQDVVYLKNGSIIKGIIIEQVPNVSITLMTQDGNKFVFEIDDIEKITKLVPKEPSPEPAVPTEPTMPPESPSSAAPIKVKLYLNGTLAWPLSPSDFSDYYKIGFPNFGAGLGFAVSPSISFMAYFDYHHFGFNGDEYWHDLGLGGLFTVSGHDATIITISGNLKAAVPTGAARPYFIGGAGLMMLSISSGSISGGGEVFRFDAQSENAFSFNAGLGADFPLASEASIFIDGRMVFGFTEDESTLFLPLRLGFIIGL